MARRKNKSELRAAFPYILVALPGAALGAAALAWAYRLDKRSKNTVKQIQNLSDYISGNSDLISELFEHPALKEE